MGAVEWSEWIRGIKAEKDTDGWFVRDVDAFKALPTKGGGCYEIAIGKTGPDRVVYAGKAVGVGTGGGTTLRSRLFSGYAKNGSHIHTKMRPALEDGNDVWFRWTFLKTKTECEEMEARLLKENEYVWNRANVRSLHEKLDSLIGDDTEKLHLLELWLEKKKSKMSQLTT